MAVNPNLNPTLNSFSNGDVLNIPGLVPVDLHSSNPYPVPFTPSIRPSAGGIPSGGGAPASAAAASAAQYPDPGTLQGSASPPGYNPVNAGGGPFGDSSPGFAGASDPMFAFSGMGGLGGYAGGGGYSNGGYNPDYFGGGSDINSAQLFSGLGSLNWGAAGDNLSSRLDSFTDNPYITWDNAGQAAINAGGMFSPLIPGIAGLLQGFNLYNPGETTGNPIADIAGTPGMVQNGVANAANWINRQFGGTYMPSSYIDPNMYGPPTPDGSPYGGTGQYIPARVMGPNPDGSAYGSVPTPTPRPDDIAQGDYGGSNLFGPTMELNPLDNLAGYYGPGGQALDIGGAGIFNSIGLSPLMTGDMGGALGFGGGGGGGWNPWELPNGGWGQ